MCIRDSSNEVQKIKYRAPLESLCLIPQGSDVKSLEAFTACLLYTSDAADERSSVDLGGRCIIKKKTSCTHLQHSTIHKE